MSDELEDREEEAEGRATREQAIRDADLRAVMATKSGRRFVWRLIDEVAGTFSGSFAGESTHHTAHQEGRRAVGRELLVEVQRVTPGDYLTALQEALSEQRAREEGNS